MEESSIVTHVTKNSRYKVQYERSATKGVVGYKCEANGDSLLETASEAGDLRKLAEIEANTGKES